MKKLLLVILLIGGVMMAQAQRSKVVSAFNYAKPKYNELEKAMKAIDEAKDHEKTNDEAKTWYYRGMIYQKIFQDTSFQNLHENPILVAMESFEKALELDDRGRYEQEVERLFNIALKQALNHGLRNLRTNKFDVAYKTLEQLINSLKLEKTTSLQELDSGIYYYTAIAAQQSGMMEEANKYYKKSVELGYEVSKSYLLQAQNYKKMQDTAQFVQTLKNGLENAEDNKDIMLMLVDYYQKSGKLKEALKYMQKAIKEDPENVTLYFAMGNVYSEMGKPQKAQESYDKAIKIDPENVDVMFNLGTLFFNNGAEKRNEANELSLDEKEKYDKLMKEANEEFKQAAKYFKKAQELAPEDKQILKTLKKIYMQLRNEEGYQEKLEKVNKKLQEIK